tara:strand:+ start:1129 stop:1356 length:228 start_codon:yes stop_codon:yes gene_type:complete
MKNQEKVISVLMDLFEDIDTTNFDLNTKFKDNDEWDSLTLLSLATLLDEEFDVSITGEQIEKINTIEDLILFVNG